MHGDTLLGRRHAAIPRPLMNVRAPEPASRSIGSVNPGRRVRPVSSSCIMPCLTSRFLAISRCKTRISSSTSSERARRSRCCSTPAEGPRSSDQARVRLALSSRCRCATAICARYSSGAENGSTGTPRTAEMSAHSAVDTTCRRMQQTRRSSRSSADVRRGDRRRLTTSLGRAASRTAHDLPRSSTQTVVATRL